MFGLLDILTISLNKDLKVNKNFKRFIIKQPGSLTWVCFLPWKTSIETAKKHNMLPKFGNLIVYEVPDDLLGKTPHLTLSSFNKIKEDFNAVFESEKLAKQRLAFLGISAGTILAFYFANRMKCEKLIVACPTSKLGEGIFRALAARNIKKEVIKNGFSAQMYDDQIKEINIENNIANLPDDIVIYLGRFDKFVPFSGGKILALKIKNSKKNVDIRISNFFGHILTLYSLGRDMKNDLLS